MLRSMTGFGAASSEADDYAFRIEMRSVNHRHLLVKTRASFEFGGIEGDLERLVKKRLSRGSVTVFLNASRAAEGAAPALDVELARRYRDQLVGLGEELGLSGDVSLESLVSMPGVIAANGDGVTQSELYTKRILALATEALDGLLEMRTIEGEALAKDVRKHADALSKIVVRIAKRMPVVVRTHQRQLEHRVGELLGGHDAVESKDIAREVAMLADRLDVSEELARLESHLEQLGLLLDKGGAIGRKLDFLVQEIFREINTIGSKCSDSKVAHWIVDAKTSAERMREQLQNVE